MNQDPVMNFLAIGSIVLPIVLYFGTDSLDVTAIAMMLMMLAQMVVLICRADDPIGDKMRADADKNEEPPH